MPTQNVVCRFTRADGIEGFMARHQPSTDAVNALERWQAHRDGRCYLVLEDEDDFIVAQLTIDANDASVGEDLMKLARQCGVAVSPAGSREIAC